MSERVPTLTERMRAHIKAHDLPPEHALAQAALELEIVTQSPAFDGKRVIAAWARARRLWRTATGESLV